MKQSTRAPAARATRATRKKASVPEAASKSEATARDPLPAILRATGELLDEVGTEGLNTTAIARRAGVSTATLYRHFPDKKAVLHAIVRSVQQERADAAVEYFERFETEPDWRAPLSDLVREMYRMRMNRPGGRSTRRALQISPELWLWDQQQHEKWARDVAKGMRRRRRSLSVVRAERVALAVVTSTVALLDLACVEQKRAKAVIDEAIAMGTAYLSPYLD